MSGINFAFGLILLTILMALYPDRISIWLLTIPNAFVQLLFTLPVVIAVSSSNVSTVTSGTSPATFAHLVLPLASPVWRGGLPPADHRVAHRRHAHAVNFTTLFTSYRDAIYEGKSPDWLALALVGLASLVLLVLATWYFKRVEPAFAKVL
jgi:ABC-type polysaccharide/polyol phosphate export permease